MLIRRIISSSLHLKMKAGVIALSGRLGALLLELNMAMKDAFWGSCKNLQNVQHPMQSPMQSCACQFVLAKGGCHAVQQAMALGGAVRNHERPGKCQHCSRRHACTDPLA